MMQILKNWLAQVSDTAARYALLLILTPMLNRSRSCMLNSAGLVIKTGSSALAKTGASVCHYIAEGVKGRIAAGTDMPALVGSVTTAMFNVFVFSVDKAGTLSVQMGVEGATEAAIKFPPLDQRKAVVGMLIINPTAGATFVGGTTALDEASLVTPNTAYISPIGPFDPKVLTGAAIL